MPKLVINPGSPEAWEVELNAGANSLGRSPENDIALEHESISSSHCQIIVSEAGALLRDVGSTSGTFVAGQLVEQIQLQPGQLFQAGGVAMQFLAEVPPPGPAARIVNQPADNIPRPPPVPESRAAPVGAVPTYCKSHPRTAARFHCPKCHASFCELCINTRQTGGTTTKHCRTCGGSCQPLQVKLPTRTTARAGFPQQVAGAFGYPFRRDGLVLLATGTFFVCLMKGALWLSGFAFLYGFVAILLLGGFGVGYFTNYFRRIVTSSAAGEEAMPDWPEVSDMASDILMPCVHLLVTVGISFLPRIVAATFLPTTMPFRGEVVLACDVLGDAYFPMAFLAVAMYDSAVAANPVTVLVSISRMPLKYLLTIVVFWAVMTGQWATELVLRQFLPVPIVPAIPATFLSLYLFTVLSRILGLLYLDNKAALGWFKR